MPLHTVLPDDMMTRQSPGSKSRLLRFLTQLGHQIRRDQRGMTLIEIMVVMTVLALMATAISISVVKVLGGVRRDKAKGDLTVLTSALDMYFVTENEYPAQGSGFSVLLEKGSDGACYIKGCKLPQDPWKEDYIYRYPGTKNPDGFDVCSKGADKQEGTEDDICNGDKK